MTDEERIEEEKLFQELLHAMLFLQHLPHQFIERLDPCTRDTYSRALHDVAKRLATDDRSEEDDRQDELGI